jgi:predicted nucleic acid-binding protein
MSERVFVDTNVLVYARDASEPEKQPRAREWLERLWMERSGALSFQVLQEFYVTVTQKLEPGLEASLARSDVRSLLAWRPISADPFLLEDAFALEDRHSISWWDALIVAAARMARCRYLISEDLQDGKEYEGLTIVNPFLRSPAEVLGP